MRDWQSVVAHVHQYRKEAAQRGESIWYRGQARADIWKLHSSLHRYIIDADAASGGTMTDKMKQRLLREEGKTAYKEFRTLAALSLHGIESTPWGVVFAMQHFGLRTRLLDWTTSFACALFFASDGWDRNSNLAIYMLSPESLNRVSCGCDGLVSLEGAIVSSNVLTALMHPDIAPPPELLPSVAVQPIYTNTRMMIQQSRFVICGDSFGPLEEQFPDAIAKLVITPPMARDLDDYLSLVGMGWSSYFPDVDGLARQQKAKEDLTLRLLREQRGGL